MSVLDPRWDVHLIPLPMKIIILMMKTFIMPIHLSKIAHNLLLTGLGQKHGRKCGSYRRVYSLMKYPITLLLTYSDYSVKYFQAVIGDLVNIHNSSVCRIIKRVCNKIVQLRKKIIKMPSTLVEI
ncbi:hypothetical protein QTP88_010994 [Uroleucon formosanum]